MSVQSVTAYFFNSDFCVPAESILHVPLLTIVKTCFIPQSLRKAPPRLHKSFIKLRKFASTLVPLVVYPKIKYCFVFVCLYCLCAVFFFFINSTFSNFIRGVNDSEKSRTLSLKNQKNHKRKIQISRKIKKRSKIYKKINNEIKKNTRKNHQ